MLKARAEKVSLPELVMFGALWLAFAGLPMRAFGVDNTLLRNAGRLLIDIGGLGFVVIGLLSMREVTVGSSRYLSCFVLFLVSVVAASTGLVKGNAMLLWVVMGLLPFISMLVVFAIPTNPRFANRLMTLLIWHTVLGVAFATYVILFEPIPSRAVWNGMNGDGMGKLAARCLYAAPFLLAGVPRLKPWQVLLAVTSWLELAVLGVLGASRGIMIATLLLIPVFLTVVAVRSRLSLRRVAAPMLAATVLLAAGTAAAGASGRWPDLWPYYFGRWEQAVGRLTGAAVEDLTLDVASSGAMMSAKQEFLEGSSRGGEFRDFLSQMEPLDYVIGRGFGGTWQSSYWGQEWLIVHIGPGHLLLVGGIPLLLAFSWVLFGAALAAWRRIAEHPLSAGAFLYIVVFTQNFLQHGAIQDEIEVYFFWICVGLAFVPVHKAVAVVNRRPPPLPARAPRQPYPAAT